MALSDYLTFWGQRSEQSEQSQETRHDGMRNDETGEGTDDDPLLLSRPVKDTIFGDGWYAAHGLVQQLCDIPAQDAVREWFDLRVKLDGEEKETDNEKELARAIMNRLDDLKAKKRIEEWIKYSRRYSQGAVLYAGLKMDIPELSLAEQPIGDPKRVEFLNVIWPPHFSRTRKGQVGIMPDWHEHQYTIGSVTVHESRLRWACRRYMPEYDEGVSVPESISLAVRANHSALKTVAKMADEFFVKVLKTDGGWIPKDEMMGFLRLIKRKLTSLGVIRIGKDDDLSRPTLSIQGIKEMLDFIWENISALTGIPRMRVTGNAQGKLAGADNDLRTYYDWIRSEFQQGDIRDALDWLTRFIIREQEGEVAKLLKGRSAELDWEFIPRPLWQVDEKTGAEIRKLEAEADGVDIDKGVIAPSEARAKRHAGLDDFAKDEGQEFTGGKEAA